LTGLPPSSRGEGDGGGVRFLLEFDNLDNYLLVVKEERRQKDDQR